MATNFIYSKMSGKNDPMYGKIEQPIMAYIERESNNYEKEKSIVTELFNVAKSNNYAESIIGQSDFDTFQSKEEGQGAENDSMEKTFKKVITHISFGKTFTITKEMVDDSKIGIGLNGTSKIAAFVRSYYRTQIKLAAESLINGTKSSFVFNKSTVDLTSADGLPLFNKAHTYASEKLAGKTQSNYYYGDFSDTSKLEIAISKLANKLRNFKDENGENMGYTADTIIIPSNRASLEASVKKIVGSERTTGTNFNDINTQYNNWTIVVLPYWETTDDRFMIMSKEANKSLLGNMFFNRVKLDIRNWVDESTRNFCWNGYCRFGVGFSSWKHILLGVSSTSTVSGATALD